MKDDYVNQKRRTKRRPPTKIVDIYAEEKIVYWHPSNDILTYMCDKSSVLFLSFWHEYTLNHSFIHSFQGSHKEPCMYCIGVQKMSQQK